MSVEVCAICRHEGVMLTRHHLVPRALHRKKRFQKNHDRKELQSNVLMICRSCHSQLHAVMTEKEMADRYNTLEAILAHPEIIKYAAWAQKRNPSGRIPVKRTRP